MTTTTPCGCTNGICTCKKGFPSYDELFEVCGPNGEVKVNGKGVLDLAEAQRWMNGRDRRNLTGSKTTDCTGVFVGPNGGYVAAPDPNCGNQFAGIVRGTHMKGESGPVQTDGLGCLFVCGAVNCGDVIGFDENGVFKVTSPTDPADCLTPVGTAIEGQSADGCIAIKLGVVSPKFSPATTPFFPNTSGDTIEACTPVWYLNDGTITTTPPADPADVCKFLGMNACKAKPGETMWFPRFTLMDVPDATCGDTVGYLPDGTFTTDTTATGFVAVGEVHHTGVDGKCGDVYVEICGCGGGDTTEDPSECIYISTFKAGIMLPDGTNNTTAVDWTTGLSANEISDASHFTIQDNRVYPNIEGCYIAFFELSRSAGPVSNTFTYVDVHLAARGTAPLPGALTSADIQFGSNVTGFHTSDQLHLHANSHWFMPSGSYWDVTFIMSGLANIGDVQAAFRAVKVG